MPNRRRRICCGGNWRASSGKNTSSSGRQPIPTSRPSGGSAGRASILEVFVRERGRRLGITTKSDLIVRDLDLLREIARGNVLDVNFTITTLDERLARLLEPRAPRPALRLAALRKLSGAGIAVGVFANPVMPGLTDGERQLDRLAKTARDAGALWFGGAPLFLMPSARKVFVPLLEREFPELAPRYRELYARSAFLGGGYKEMLRARVAGSASGTGWKRAHRVSAGIVGRGGAGGAVSATVKAEMDLAAFDYELPGELIAQEPLVDRAGARMLVLHRTEQRWEDRRFRDFPEFLGPGDCLVLNDSRVFPARLFGRRTGVHALPIGKKNPKRREYLSGEVEVFLLRAVSPDGRDWEALVRPGRKMPVGERVGFSDGLQAR